MTNTTNVFASFAHGLRPPPRITVSEWADTYRQLPREGAAEPGKWRTDRTPYLREIMDAMSDHHPAREVVVMKGAQVGGTECALNGIGYTMHHDPAPTMVVMPTENTAKEWSLDRLTPMITATPELSGLFGSGSRDPNNATKRKKFPGGYLRIVHATSAAELRSRPARKIFMDECDGYPTDVDGEGCPVQLVRARARTFKTTRKIVMISTPTFEHTSRIKAAYDKSTQHKYHVPCPECGHFQVLTFENLKWPSGKPHEAKYECEDCKHLWQEHDKSWVLGNGEWRQTNPDADPEIYGFHLSSLYSPAGWMSWGECASMFHEATTTKNKELLQVFVNTVLGETWRDKGETPDWEKLYLRRLTYARGTVPDGGVVLTMGVDVQRDRLEGEIVAWGERLRTWSVDYITFVGDPSQPDVWNQLAEVLDTEFQHDSGGRLRISRAAIDSGFETSHVYAFCRRYPPTRVMCIKGMANLTTPLGRPKLIDINVSGTSIKNGVTLWGVGVDMLKDELYSWLLQPLPEDGEETPRGWCEWPQYGREYFMGLTAEERRIKGNKHVWEKIRERNEPVDCRVYARAAGIGLGINRWDAARWQQERDAVINSSRPGAPAVGEVRRVKRKRRSGGWL